MWNLLYYVFGIHFNLMLNTRYLLWSVIFILFASHLTFKFVLFFELSLSPSLSLCPAFSVVFHLVYSTSTFYNLKRKGHSTYQNRLMSSMFQKKMTQYLAWLISLRTRDGKRKNWLSNNEALDLCSLFRTSEDWAD